MISRRRRLIGNVPRMKCKIVSKFNIALLGSVILVGCDARTVPEPVPPSVSNTVLRGMPDFTPRPGVIPTADDLDHAGPKFCFRINSSGEIYRNDQLTSRSGIVDELLATPNLTEVAVVFEGDSDVRVPTVVEWQSYLSDSVPDLGAVTYVVVDGPDGG